MFENLTYGHLLVLTLAALFILGPERLPEAASWLARTIRQMQEWVNGTREQLRRELGTDLGGLREPLDELRKPLEELRGYDPRRALTQAIFTEDPASKPPGTAPSPVLRPGERPPIDPDAT